MIFYQQISICYLIFLKQGFYRLHQCVLMLKLRFYSQIQPKLPKYNLDFGAINKCRHVRSGKCWIRVRVVILHPSLTSPRSDYDPVRFEI